MVYIATCTVLHVVLYTQVPVHKSYKMRKAIFGLGPKEIAFETYDGNTVEVSFEDVTL